jgi:hypothetical protein
MKDLKKNLIGGYKLPSFLGKRNNNKSIFLRGPNLINLQ